MFIPVHCPSPGCSNHHYPQTANWYRFFGTYRTKTFGTVPRFRCSSCRKTFSSQTFSIDYYAKKSLKMRDVYAQVNGGVGIRKIARNLNVHHNTIRNRIARMTRNAILIHQQILSQTFLSGKTSLPTVSKASASVSTFLTTTTSWWVKVPNSFIGPTTSPCAARAVCGRIRRRKEPSLKSSGGHPGETWNAHSERCVNGWLA